MQKLNAPGLDHDAAMKCFEENKPQRTECHKQLREKMCTLDENKMIDVNETWQGRGHGHGHGHGHKKNHNHHNSSDSNSIEEHGIEHEHEHGHEHGHFKRGFFMFIKKAFGKSGKEFTKCMRHCFRHKRQNINCAKKNQ
uniref:Uncharacterized protein n=1 Tax=Acrobeloides nanus TaxID=290746 RepID=A0A914CVJ6_9BILA